MDEKPRTAFVACSKCGWVHFAQSSDEVENSVSGFNRYFDGLEISRKRSYRYMVGQELEDFLRKPETEQLALLEDAKSSVDRYKRCFRCGASHTSMRLASEGEAPAGSTIQPIMWPVPRAEATVADER